MSIFEDWHDRTIVELREGGTDPVPGLPLPGCFCDACDCRPMQKAGFRLSPVPFLRTLHRGLQATDPATQEIARGLFADGWADSPERLAAVARKLAGE